MLDRLIASRISNEEAGLLVPYAIAGVDAMIYDRTIDGSGTRYPAFYSLSITPLTLARCALCGHVRRTGAGF